MLVMEILPLPLPGDVGLNVVVKVVFCPAFKVRGVVRPERPKPAPDAEAAEIVTLAVPELVSVIVCDPLLPTKTFAKLKLEGFAARDP